MPFVGSGGVLVKVVSAGICGTDLHLMDTGLLAGRIPGHEIAGYAPDGRAVAVEPTVTCGSCEYCLRGDHSICDRAIPDFVGIGADGGMAEFVSVPESSLVELPASLHPRDACLVEPVAVSVRGLLMCRLGAGDHVAVVGGGSIGLCAVAVARAMGATVELHARHDHQKAAGERLGALEPSDRSAKLVVDAAGTTSSLTEAVHRCDRGGTVLALATYWDDTQIPGLAISGKEIRIQASMMYGRTSGFRDVDLAAAVVAAEPELARVVITDRFELDGVAKAFERAGDRTAGAIKVVLEP